MKKIMFSLILIVSLLGMTSCSQKVKDEQLLPATTGQDDFKGAEKVYVRIQSVGKDDNKIDSHIDGITVKY